MTVLKFIFVAVLMTLPIGCISAEAKQQIRDNAAATQADERDWPKLTDAQRAIAEHDNAKAWATLNYAVNGVAIPAAYVDSASK